MKFVQFASLTAFFAAVASAQNVVIGSPQDGASVTAGSNLVVQIDKPNSLTGSADVAVVIGVTSCASSPCPSPYDKMGYILYNGGYNSQYQTAGQPPYQNFTVLIPSTFAKGQAQINVAHVGLEGAGPAPFMETKNVTVTIV